MHADSARAGPATEAGAGSRIALLGGGHNSATTPGATDAQAIGLRPYQTEAIQDIRAAFARGVRRVLRQAPTGSGKGEEIGYMAERGAARGRRVCVLVHRMELIDQVDRTLCRRGVAADVIAPDFPQTNARDARVHIASIAKLARRIERWRDSFDLILVDECHHATSPTWRSVIELQRTAHVVGFTATPERLDGRGLGEIFQHLVVGPMTAELIEAGYLSPFVVYEPTARPDMSSARIRAGDYAIEDLRERLDGLVIGAAVRERQRLCPGVPTVAFCVDVKHSQMVAEAFRAAGVRAVHLDGDTPASERRSAIAGLASGEIKVICNYGLISEGLDVPGIGAVLLLRPTASLTLYLQQVGRAIRPSPGKDRALILDFSGNCARHGLPDEPREWSLNSRPRRLRDAPVAPRVRRCAGCGTLNHEGRRPRRRVEQPHARKLAQSPQRPHRRRPALRSA